tara:strand:- start:428 stop:703 length:276 start_codon:yes stop_codon:yes gene_type:complete
MSFWLYDPKSFKDSALFPTGGLGNFLNTLTLVLVALITAIKTKFTDIADNKTLMIYGSLAAAVILTTGLVFCGSEESSELSTTYNFDLSYE